MRLKKHIIMAIAIIFTLISGVIISGYFIFQNKKAPTIEEFANYNESKKNGKTITEEKTEVVSESPLQKLKDAAKFVQDKFATDDNDVVRWEYNTDGTGYKPYGTPPECPPLEFASPADMSLATTILYPGQIRGQNINAGDNYKPHGGFRFDNQKTNDMEVRAPFDGYVWRGSRYLVESGEIQYAFDIVNSCGIMHRLGHLLELSPTFQKLADKFPEAKLLDSRTHETEPIFVKKGDLVAIKIGLKQNVFFDWGAYDLRKENDASKDESYRKKYWDIRWFTFHALCIFDYMPADDQTIIEKLPAADWQAGKSSDYCK